MYWWNYLIHIVAAYASDHILYKNKASRQSSFRWQQTPDSKCSESNNIKNTNKGFHKDYACETCRFFHQLDKVIKFQFQNFMKSDKAIVRSLTSAVDSNTASGESLGYTWQ